MMKRGLIVLALLMVLSVNAQLYADVIFHVGNDGVVTISGNTNYEGFKGTTNKLTSKQGDFWILNITSPNFEEFVYSIELPQNSVINYIKSDTPVRIEDKGSIVVTSTGTKEKVNIVIQYSISKGNSNSLLTWIIGIIAIIVIVGIIYYIKNPKKPSTPEKELNRDLYTDRQLMILDYLKEHGTVTQAHLEKDLNLPKSSLSRNIQTLVQKGIIFKETKGMSNVIGFKE